MSLPAKRLNQIFVQEVMVSFHRADVNGELGIFKAKKTVALKEVLCVWASMATLKQEVQQGREAASPPQKPTCDTCVVFHAHEKGRNLSE